MTEPLSRRRLLGLGAATAAGLALTACNLDRASSPDRTATPDDPDAGWGGPLIDPPLTKPDVTLETMDGEPFNLKTDTAGQLTFLFLGYTNCPDQCPVYVSSLASALELVGDGPGSKPQVLFLGVDTKRDTPEQLKKFLGVNKSFIGLTGTPEAIDEVSTSFGWGTIEFGEEDKDGNYAVVHYSRAVAFTPDDQGHRLYGFDTRSQAFAKDLPRLAEGTYE